MKNIISRDRSVILACDVSLEEFEEMLKVTAEIEGIGAYKIPATSGREGWEKWTLTAKKYTQKPLIYDGQKSGTDIPDTAEKFMRDLAESEFDAVILFPRVNDYKTQEAWIKAAQDQELGVIVGGKMTHQKDYPLPNEINEIYSRATDLGVTNFVVPGNQPDFIKHIKKLIESKGIEPIFYAPGFIAQGGDISESAMAAGEKFHAIVGRGIYQDENIRQACLDLASKL